mmetsp:Transcript_18581/g.23064  ORF Transcript_18581/g.23064 Transcript_18581/m.23064 type:complete len:310 (-) Transcript_18581:161-1090(-)
MNISLILTITFLLSVEVFASKSSTWTRKLRKSSKSGKKQSAKSGKKLVAYVQRIPSYTGDLAPQGVVTIRYDDDGSFLFNFDMAGLDPNCSPDNKCGVYIAEGTSCDDVFGTYYAPDATEWSVTNGAWYDTFSRGSSNSAFRFDNGYDHKENRFHAVIVNDSDGTAIGCGILDKGSNEKTLSAVFSTYPGYTGDNDASGSVSIIFNEDDTFEFCYDIWGLESNCQNCGIHIHAGLSCNSHEEIMGHGWNSVKVQDLWTTAGGAFYNTNDVGEAYGCFTLYNGYSRAVNYHHAVVIHEQDGRRAACGVLA